MDEPISETKTIHKSIRDRAWRRAQRNRIRERRIDMILNAWAWRESTRLAQDPHFVGLLIDTPHPCSCLGCGNQRKWYGKTRREIAAGLEEQEYTINDAEPTVCP